MAFDPVQVGYTGGTVSIPSSASPQNLIALIQSQLDPNATPEAFSCTIQTDNSGAVYFGPYKTSAGGLLSASNFAFVLQAGGAYKTYSPGSFGSNNPIGNVFVFNSSGSAVTIHVEIIP